MNTKSIYKSLLALVLLSSLHFSNFAYPEKSQLNKFNPSEITQNNSNLKFAQSQDSYSDQVKSELYKAREKDASEIYEAIKVWAVAWANKDMPAYYNSYKQGYAPDGQTHTQWRKFRKDRIQGKKNTIHIEVRDIKLEVGNGIGVAKFKQLYKTGKFKENSNKVLQFRKFNNGWKIVGERSFNN